MRRIVSFSFDIATINRLREAYANEVGKTKNLRSFSSFCEELLTLGLAFSKLDKETLKKVETYMKKRGVKDFSVAVEQLLKLGLEASEILP